ncbi:hypothetical protein GQ53DRAFT_880645 [Thozetella sp. PMI_491]|nr:hypothetical protein GQ53DRAFT_880645 [Thozetella sp. PMI_491]
MATSDPIPVLLCGKIPTHIQATTESMKPEYNVIKVCSDIETATSTITALMSSPTDSTVIDGRTYPKPRLIIMGGGYLSEDFSSIYDNVKGAKDVPWIRPSVRKPGATGPPPTGPPPAEVIVRQLKKVLDEHKDEIKNNEGAGQIWWM